MPVIQNLNIKNKQKITVFSGIFGEKWVKKILKEKKGMKIFFNKMNYGKFN